MKYTPKKIFKLRDGWAQYMRESWKSGEDTITFIEKNEQNKGGQEYRRDNFIFNFLSKGLKEVKAQAKDLEISLSLFNLNSCDTKEEDTFKKLFSHLMMNNSNLQAFRDCLDKVYSFGQGVFHIKGHRENEDTLNESLKVECLEDPRQAFFDYDATCYDFRDGKFCGRVYPVKRKDLIRWYPSIKRKDGKEETEIIDFWYKSQKKATYLKLSTGEYKRESQIDEARDEVEFGSEPKTSFYTCMTYCRALLDHPRFLEKQENIELNALPLVFNAGGQMWDAENKKYFYYPFGWNLKDTQILINNTGSILIDILKGTKGDKWLFNPEHVQPKGAKTAAENINTREGGIILGGNLQEIRREIPQQLPQGLLEVFMQSPNILQNLMGSYFDNNQAQIKAVSGVALDKLFKRLDLAQNNVIVKHLECVMQIGHVLQQMIPLYYYQQRMVALECEDGSITPLVINERTTQNGGIETISNNVKKLKNQYTYRVAITPSKRLRDQNAQAALQSIYQIMPQAAQSTIDLYVKTLDVSMSDVLSKRLSASIPKDLIDYANGTITYQEYQQKMQQQQMMAQQHQAQAMQQSPDGQYMQAKSHAEISKSQTDQFNAETARAKMEAEAKNAHIKNVTEGVKFSMENANTQHQQKLELEKTMIDHVRALSGLPSE